MRANNLKTAVRSMPFCSGPPDFFSTYMNMYIAPGFKPLKILQVNNYYANPVAQKRKLHAHVRYKVILQNMYVATVYMPIHMWDLKSTNFQIFPYYYVYVHMYMYMYICIQTHTRNSHEIRRVVLALSTLATSQKCTAVTGRLACCISGR